MEGDRRRVHSEIKISLIKGWIIMHVAFFEKENQLVIEIQVGNLRTSRELEVVTRSQAPSALFLAETWAEDARLR